MENSFSDFSDCSGFCTRNGRELLRWGGVHILLAQSTICYNKSMKKFLIIFLCLFFSFSAVEASDDFSRRLKICNPYETSFYTPSKEIYAKGVLGVYTDVNTLTQQCCYYVQKEKNLYDLCTVSTKYLSSTKSIEENAVCKSVFKEAVKDAKMNIVASVGVILRTINGTFEVPIEKEEGAQK